MTRQIESLVESSYSDLAPSHHVEEELMRDLPPQKARPRRSALVAIAALLLIGLTIWGVGGEDGPVEGPHLATAGPVDPSMTLATVARPKSGIVAKAKDDIHVRVVSGSGIRVLRNDKWIEVSLNELGSHIAKFERQKRIVLSIDRRTPWIHVQWIMLICAERKMPNLAVAVKQADGEQYHLDATLPTDLAPGIAGTRRPTVRVHALPKAERETRFGIQVVQMPTEVVYRIGEVDTPDLGMVRRCLIDSRDEPPQARGEIKAMPKTPFETVARLMAEFRQTGFAKLEFYGVGAPTQEAREARVLPYPGGKRWERKPSLEFAVVEGDPAKLPRVFEILQKRLTTAGYSRFAFKHTPTGFRLSLAPGDDTTLARRLVERKEALLEFHITVEPDEDVFGAEWKRREKGEKPSEGFRWYALNDHAKKTYAKSRLPGTKQPFVLCRTDSYRITGASFHEVRAERDTGGIGSGWAVTFAVREAHQQNLADLTKVPEGSRAYLAIILNGKVHSAPDLRDRLRTTVQITGGFSEADAKALAALLQSEPLPIRLALKRR